jgi:diaminobutyrate-2-oxoglutarate transaminase
MKLFEKWESDVRGYSRVYPAVFKTASNSRQVDESGKSYIDFFAGAGVLNFGHNNPKMKKAIVDYIQGDGLTHSLDMATTAKREFIKAFVETILKPRDMKYKLQFVGPTGTNAVEAALKMARRVTGRTNVMAFSHGFHGMTLGSLACTANDYFRNAAGVPLNYVIRLPYENDNRGSHVREKSLRDIQSLRTQFSDPSSGLKPPAAFILEVIQAEGGVIVATRTWLEELRQLARDYGSLFIIDEIQVGCGRTGSYFSFDGMDLDPDIICLAKGIGGFGTPLAMNLIKPEHDQHWLPGEHTGTFRGQGLSFIAGREGLRYFENDELMKCVKANGARIAARLGAVVEQFPNNDFEVRGQGMIYALDLASGDLAKTVTRHCFERGLIISPCGSGGRVLKVLPPLTIPTEDLDAGLDILAESVKEGVTV